MSRSAIREGIDGLGRRPARRVRPTAAPKGRGGLLDLILVTALVWAVGSRSPVGGLGWYAWERLTGGPGELPSLTAYFESGAVAPPTLDELPVLPPLHDDTSAIAEGGLPEPWRTAARIALAEPPSSVQARLVAVADLPEEDRAVAWLDRAWQQSGEVEAALEELAIGPELRARAIARARAAGEQEPWRYVTHRRYLPGQAARDADRVVQGTLGLATVLDLTWPVQAPHAVTSPWGDRDHPILGERRFHNGVDLAVPVGTPIHAAQSGTVAIVGEDERSGRYVVVDHGNGVRTAYCHLSEAKAERGARIARGDVVALSGNTGRSTGPHLHYVVRIAGQTVDPERFRRDDS